MTIQNLQTQSKRSSLSPRTNTDTEQTPYPVQALPAVVRQAVVAYQQYGQQPLSLVACSALASVSLACQAMANIARDSYLVSPVSLYFLTVAQSGVLFFASFFLKSCPKLYFDHRVRSASLLLPN